MAYNAPIHSQGTVPPASAQGISGILPGQSAINTTKILSLTGFSKDLKTRDIQNIFVDFEDDRGGYRIKWVDDTGCLIVFSDPLTAKRAFLRLLANPHPHLISSKTATGEFVVPKLEPYIGEDVDTVVASVANRPRSRSIATNNNNNVTGSPSSGGGNGSGGGGGHARRISTSAGGHGRGNSVASAGVETFRADRRSFGRQSLGQGQMQAIIDEARSATSAAQQLPPLNGSPIDRAVSPMDTTAADPSASNSSSASSSTPAAPANGGGAIDWSNMMTQNFSANSVNRTRAGSGSNSNSFSPPVSPERGMRAGATSPSTLRRLVQQRG